MSIAFKKEDICPALVDFSIKFGVLPTRFVREVVLFCIALIYLGIKRRNRMAIPAVPLLINFYVKIHYS